MLEEGRGDGLIWDPEKGQCSVVGKQSSVGATYTGAHSGDAGPRQVRRGTNPPKKEKELGCL